MRTVECPSLIGLKFMFFTRASTCRVNPALMFWEKKMIGHFSNVNYYASNSLK